VCLVPLGRGRSALYAESPDTAEPPPAPDAWRFRHWLHSAGVHWRRLVLNARVRLSDEARLKPEGVAGTSRDAAGGASIGASVRRRRDRILCRLADTVDDQRALWSLRGVNDATLLYAASLASTQVFVTLDSVLIALRRHHGRWMVAHALLFIVTGALFLLPGPNVIAYYFGIRAFGHLQSWRGARRARVGVHWTLEASEPIDELAGVADLPEGARAACVESVAARLDLPGLAGFVERNAA
jgi:hypothetical protein